MSHSGHAASWHKKQRRQHLIRLTNWAQTWFFWPSLIWEISDHQLCGSDVTGINERHKHHQQLCPALVETGLLVPKEESAMILFFFFLTLESYWRHASTFHPMQIQTCEEISSSLGYKQEHLRWSPTYLPYMQVEFKRRRNPVVFILLVLWTKRQRIQSVCRRLKSFRFYKSS